MRDAACEHGYTGYERNLCACDACDDYPFPSRRVSLGLSGGGEMHVSIPGRPNEPIDERTLEALRQIGEAAVAKMIEENEDDGNA